MANGGGLWGGAAPQRDQSAPAIGGKRDATRSPASGGALSTLPTPRRTRPLVPRQMPTIPAAGRSPAGSMPQAPVMGGGPGFAPGMGVMQPQPPMDMGGMGGPPQGMGGPGAPGSLGQALMQFSQAQPGGGGAPAVGTRAQAPMLPMGARAPGAPGIQPGPRLTM
jgi:hypothetical protein